MRTRLAGLSTALLALAFGLSASAQTQNSSNANANKDQNQNQNRDQNAGETRHIHGVVAGVTIEGETAIDAKNNRAVTAEMTFLTIVGWPHRGNDEARNNANDRDRDRAGNNANNRDRDNANNRDRDNANANNRDRDRNNANANANATDRDRDRDRNNANANDRGDRRRRANVYVVWVSPKAKVRDARDNADQPKDSALNDLELGDHVDIAFVERKPTGENPNAQSRHGRHRTYFGDATSITILQPMMAQRDRDRDRGERGGDRNQGNQNNNQNNDRTEKKDNR